MEYKRMVSSFLQSRKNANNLVDLINKLEEKTSNKQACLLALQRLFIEVFKRGDFVIDETLRATNPKAYKIEEQYLKWLTDLYEGLFIKLVNLLGAPEAETSTKTLETLLNLLAAETRNPILKANFFPAERLQKIIFKILSMSDNKLVLAYVPFLSNRDMLFYTWKVLKEILPGSQENTDELTFNILELIENMTLPKKNDSNKLFCYDDPTAFHYNEEFLKKWVQKVWHTLTNRRLSASNHRKLLLVLIEKYLSDIRKPTLFTDFFAGSLAMGGVTSLLALQGMSVLVTKHNLECPNIFGRLYNMFEADIFHTRYKARLFYLADLFLQSTYVSEQLVAAFAKRLSRLSLVAQAADLVLIMHFVGNLLIRHPGLMIMVHSRTAESVESDPYSMEEQDPVKSRALDSSLWELALLKNHVQPKVAAAAKFLDNNMPAIEWDFREQLEYSYVKMFESEIKKNAKITPALTFVRPVSIAQLRDDRLYKMWAFT